MFNELIDKSVDEAKQLAEAKDMRFRVTEEDGVFRMVTCDYWDNRINVGVEKGIVKKVFGLG